MYPSLLMGRARIHEQTHLSPLQYSPPPPTSQITPREEEGPDPGIIILPRKIMGKDKGKVMMEIKDRHRDRDKQSMEKLRRSSNPNTNTHKQPNPFIPSKLQKEGISMVKRANILWREPFQIRTQITTKIHPRWKSRKTRILIRLLSNGAQGYSQTTTDPLLTMTMIIIMIEVEGMGTGSGTGMGTIHPLMHTINILKHISRKHHPHPS